MAEKYTPMTDGERMIWAATFATCTFPKLYNPPPYLCTPDHESERTEWSKAVVASAVEDAHHSVLNAREAMDSVKDGWGHESGESKALAEMITKGVR